MKDNRNEKTSNIHGIQLCPRVLIHFRRQPSYTGYVENDDSVFINLFSSQKKKKKEECTLHILQYSCNRRDIQPYLLQQHHDVTNVQNKNILYILV